MGVEHEFAEHLDVPRLPDVVEGYFAEQRVFWRALRHGGVLTDEEQREITGR